MSLSWDEGFLQDIFCVWVCVCETQHGVLESDQLAWELETWISKSVFVVNLERLPLLGHNFVKYKIKNLESV